MILRAAIALGLFAAAACAFDDGDRDARRPDGAAAARGGDAMNGSGGRGTSTGGAAGELVDGCADLDTDGVADCTTTLLANPSFTNDVDGWTPLGSAELVWAPQNALTDLPSGAAKLSARTPFARASQCVTLTGEQLVIAYANAFATPEADAVGAQALLEVAAFASTDCSGAPESSFETPPSTVTNAWTTLNAGGLTLTTTNSVSIALVGVKAAADASQSTYFDNVMLKTQGL